MFALAGLAFWMGGWAISEFAKMERTLAEMEGIALTVLFVVLGAVAKVAEDRFEEGDESKTSLFDGGLFRK